MRSRTDLVTIGSVIVLTLLLVGLSAMQGRHCPPAADKASAWALAPWPLKVAFIQSAGALGLLLLTLSRRFVPPMPLSRAPQRQSGEYIASMAQLLRRAQAHEMAVDTLNADLRRMLARALGLPQRASTAALVQATRSQRPELAEEVRQILEEGEALSTTHSAEASPDEGAVVRWARRCAALRRRWEGRA